MNRLISIFLLFFSISCHSQSGDFIFIEKVYFLDGIRSDDGTQKISFVGINNGSKEYVIDTVFTECNCIHPQIDTKNVLPGDSVKVTLDFNPLNKVGTNDIKIGVVSNKDTIELFVRGNIMPSLSKDVLLNFSNGDSCVKYETSGLDFGVVLDTSNNSKKLRLYNNCDKPINAIIELDSLSSLSVDNTSFSLKPHSINVIDMVFTPNKEINYGFYTESFTVNLENNVHQKFLASAVIQESLIKSDSLGVPKVRVNKSIYEFGSMKKGTNKSHVFNIKNVGSQVLELRSITPTCECVTVDLEKATIKPGESIDLIAVYQNENRVGYQRKTIVIVTNDPARPYLQLLINGKVIR